MILSGSDQVSFLRMPVYIYECDQCLESHIIKIYLARTLHGSSFPLLWHGLITLVHGTPSLTLGALLPLRVMFLFFLFTLDLPIFSMLWNRGAALLISADHLLTLRICVKDGLHQGLANWDVVAADGEQLLVGLRALDVDRSPTI